jgi:hypothetical protein
MNLLVRAIVTGFGMAAGAALYKRFAKQLGLEEAEDDKEKVPEEVAEDGLADEGAARH